MTDLIDAKDQRHRLHQATAQVAELKRQGARVMHALGTVLKVVYDEELWRAGGFPSFTAWVEDEVGLARRSAWRAMEVARHFNLGMAEAYGLEKLNLGLRYLELTRAEERPGDLVAASLKLRGEHGRFEAVPFHEATVRQVQAAIDLVLATSRRKPEVDESLGARLSRLSAALPPPPKGMSPAHQRVEVARTRAGGVALTFRQIPLEELEIFLEAVRREMLEQG